MDDKKRKGTKLSPAELAALKYEELMTQMEEENSDDDSSAFKYQQRLKR